MNNLKLKHLLNKKGILFPLLVVCSLLSSEKTLAVWDNSCCKVYYPSAISNSKENCVNINFKFFEYEKLRGIKNSYLKEIEVQYSTNNGDDYIHLMSASTEIQATRTWARILLHHKQDGSKIDLFLHPHGHPGFVSINWQDGSNLRLDVCNNPKINNQTWLCVNWFPRKDQYNTTHIRVLAKWIIFKNHQDENVVLVYEKTPKKEKLISNSFNLSNSFPNQEIETEAKINTVKVYKEANSIVVNGALSENIQVYTTKGKLVKSMLADCDLFQIPLPANQRYIVNVGQLSYKIAL